MKYLCESCVNFPCTKDMNMLALSCPVYSPEPKPITNADRIRSMTDEELAEHMGDVQTWGGCPNHGARNCTENCADCWLDWLREEVSDA